MATWRLGTNEMSAPIKLAEAEFPAWLGFPPVRSPPACPPNSIHQRVCTKQPHLVSPKRRPVMQEPTADETPDDLVTEQELEVAVACWLNEGGHPGPGD
jgi:hypothetical protein